MPRSLTVFLLLAAALSVASPAFAQDPNACDVEGEYPDLIAGRLTSVVNWGTVSAITAYSTGATSCNLGSCWVNWFFNTDEHPVFAQNLYRLKDGRFEQIGQSWVHHRFFALSQSYCETGCLPTNGSHLGVQCSNDDSAAITGGQQYLGPRYEVNASAGTIEFPFATNGETGNAIYKRLQVHNVDLDPAANVGARYFLEGQQVAADDAAAGMLHNNASYREVTIAPGDYDLVFAGPTITEIPAILAWPTIDPLVMSDTIDLDGRIHVASTAKEIGGGLWEYEYAVHNLNSHRSIGAVEVPIPEGAAISAIGFHDVDYHSGEPFDGTDWPGAVDSGGAPHRVAWSTTSHDVDPDANAIRWGTLYNFRFQADVPPELGELTLGLFRPGDPDQVTADVLVPQLCDSDSACDIGENSCNCLLDCGSPAGSELSCDDGFDDDCNGQVDCDDAQCCGDGGCPSADVDTDSHLDCEDCNDHDGSIWGTPGEVGTLLVGKGPADRALLDWEAPVDPGAAAVTYAVVRSQDPADFLSGADCLPLFNPNAPSAVDAEPPASGMFFAYLPRAVNGCPLGEGSVGEGREAISCP